MSNVADSEIQILCLGPKNFGMICVAEAPYKVSSCRSGDPSKVDIQEIIQGNVQCLIIIFKKAGWESIVLESRQ